MPEITAEFALGGAVRSSIGMLMLTVAGICLWTATSVEWGVAWTLVVPAVISLIPAWALLQRRRLTRTGNDLRIIDGWLWRRALSVSLRDAELEKVPTAGLYAIVLHYGARSWPVGLWLSRTTAEQLLAFLDAAPCGPRPRRLAVLPLNDR